MLGDITVADEIYVICGYTDMRKSIDGLCAVVKDQLNMDPSRPNAIYLFCGRRSDRIKVLLHERANYAQTECQFRYCGTAIPFLTVRSTAR